MDYCQSVATEGIGGRTIGVGWSMENRTAGIAGEILLIGVGNEMRNDDGLGLYIARELRRRSLKGITITEHHGEGTALMEAWKGCTAVLLVDAMLTGGAPGMAHRIDASHVPVPAALFLYSSHAFGVAGAIELARELHQLPPTVILYGIEGELFEAGIGLSPCVVRSVPELISMIEHDLHILRPDLHPTHDVVSILSVGDSTS